MNQSQEFKGYRVYVDFPYSTSEVARAKNWGFRYDGDAKLWYLSLYHKNALESINVLPNENFVYKYVRMVVYKIKNQEKINEVESLYKKRMEEAMNDDFYLNFRNKIYKDKEEKPKYETCKGCYEYVLLNDIKKGLCVECDKNDDDDDEEEAEDN